VKESTDPGQSHHSAHHFVIREKDAGALATCHFESEKRASPGIWITCIINLV
jgi:hypothetical protein